jgi:trans-aconitate 2-methyltransferase
LTKANDWDPREYLKFKNERTQPSIDLVTRIRAGCAPSRILDVGCGPGNSSQILLERWPGAGLTGIDSSPAMIEKARRDFPGQEWQLSDAASYAPAALFDLIFSSSAIQWIPNHRDLAHRMTRMLTGEGVLAVQTPRFDQMAVNDVLESVSGRLRWRKITERCAGLFTCHDPGFYYELLSGLMDAVEIWETDYFHIMASHLAILDWIRSTGMKPYLDAIGDENANRDFEAEVLEGLKRVYPLQSDGRVLFPFKRLFFVAYGPREA